MFALPQSPRYCTITKFLRRYLPAVKSFTVLLQVQEFKANHVFLELLQGFLSSLPIPDYKPPQSVSKACMLCSGRSKPPVYSERSNQRLSPTESELCSPEVSLRVSHILWKNRRRDHDILSHCAPPKLWTRVSG